MSGKAMVVADAPPPGASRKVAVARRSSIKSETAYKAPKSLTEAMEQSNQNSSRQNSRISFADEIGSNLEEVMALTGNF